MSESSPIPRAARHDVDFSGRLEPLEHGAKGLPALNIKIVNFSVSGVGVVCKSPIKPDSTWTLHIDPELCDDVKETVVVRTCQEEDDHYRCGLQFVTAATLFAQAGLGMDTAIHSLKTVEPEQQVKDNSYANVDSQAQIVFDDESVVDQMSHVHVTAVDQLKVKGNMVACRASLGGPLQVGGCIAGGRIETTNTIQVTTLGHPGQSTTVVLGCSPRTNALITRVPNQLESFDQQIKEKHKELAYIKNHGSEIGHTARERTMELDFELQELEEKRELLQIKFDQLLNHYLESVRVELKIEQAVHPGVIIQFANQHYRFNRSIQGPLSITCTESTKLCVALHDQPPRLLADLLAA